MTSSSYRVGLLVAGAAATGILLAEPHSAGAQSADEIRAEATRILKNWEYVSEDIRLTPQGEITVEAAGDGHKIIFPTLLVSGDKNDPHVTFEGLTLTMTPQADDTTLLSATLPNRIPVTTPEGKLIGEMNVGGYDVSAIYDPRIESLSRIDAKATEIRLSSPEEPGEIVFGEISTVTDMKADGPDDWSGNGLISFDKISIDLPDAQVSIDRVAVATESADQALESYAKAMMEIGGNWRDGPFDVAEPKNLDQKTLDVFEALPGYLGTMGSAVQITGVKAVTPEGTLAFEQLAYGGEFAAFDTNDSELAFGVEHKGLSLTVPPPISDFVPGEMVLDAEITRFPGDTFWKDIVIASIREAVKHNQEADKDKKKSLDDAAFDKMSEKMMTHFIGAVIAAKTHFNLAEFEVITPTIEVEGTGAAEADGEAQMLAVGSAGFTVFGLDETLEKYSALKQDKELAQILAAATFFKGLGKPRAEQGANVYDYEVLLTKEGKITVNGVDFSALQGMMR